MGERKAKDAPQHRYRLCHDWNAINSIEMSYYGTSLTILICCRTSSVVHVDVVQF